MLCMRETRPWLRNRDDTTQPSDPGECCWIPRGPQVSSVYFLSIIRSSPLRILLFGRTGVPPRGTTEGSLLTSLAFYTFYILERVRPEGNVCVCVCLRTTETKQNYYAFAVTQSSYQSVVFCSWWRIETKTEGKVGVQVFDYKLYISGYLQQLLLFCSGGYIE